MSHKIERGQVYESCQSVRSMPGENYTRIRVVSIPESTAVALLHYGPYAAGKVMVATVTEDGREVRPRPLEVDQLHDSGTTKTGQPRRTGYRLVEGG